MVLSIHLFTLEEMIASQFTLYYIIATFFRVNGIVRLVVHTFYIFCVYFFYYHFEQWNKSIYIYKTE